MSKQSLKILLSRLVKKNLTHQVFSDIDMVNIQFNIFFFSFKVIQFFCKIKSRFNIFLNFVQHETNMFSVYKYKSFFIKKINDQIKKVSPNYQSPNRQCFGIRWTFQFDFFHIFYFSLITDAWCKNMILNLVQF